MKFLSCKSLINPFLKLFNKVIEYSSPDIKDSSFDFEQIGYCFKQESNESVLQSMDETMIYDIDFHELFIFLDRTSSKIGQQFFFCKLLQIKHYYDFSRQENLIQHLTNNDKLRIKAQKLLSILNKNEAYSISFLLYQSNYIIKPKHFLSFQFFLFLQ
jgi:hypothetical protein